MEKYLTQNFIKTTIQVIKQTYRKTLIFIFNNLEEKISYLKILYKNFVLIVKNCLKLKKSKNFPRSPTNEIKIYFKTKINTNILRRFVCL